ncbi:uncharacterized protein PHA67_014376 [Liasis olivaceus]
MTSPLVLQFRAQPGHDFQILQNGAPAGGCWSRSSNTQFGAVGRSPGVGALPGLQPLCAQTGPLGFALGKGPFPSLPPVRRRQETPCLPREQDPPRTPTTLPAALRRTHADSGAEAEQDALPMRRGTPAGDDPGEQAGPEKSPGAPPRPARAPPLRESLLPRPPPRRRTLGGLARPRLRAGRTPLPAAPGRPARPPGAPFPAGRDAAVAPRLGPRPRRLRSCEACRVAARAGPGGCGASEGRRASPARGRGGEGRGGEGGSPRRWRAERRVPAAPAGLPCPSGVLGGEEGASGPGLSPVPPPGRDPLPRRLVWTEREDFPAFRPVKPALLASGGRSPGQTWGKGREAAAEMPPGKTCAKSFACKLSLVRKPCKGAAPRNHAGGETLQPKAPSGEAGETLHVLRVREILCSPVPPFDPPEGAHREWITSVFGVWEILSWSVGLCQTSQEPPRTKALQMRRVWKAFC